MKNRIVSSLALAAAVTLGATGCSLISEQTTLYEYAPSDGVSVNAGEVQLRNMLLITSEEEGSYNLVFTAQNNAEQAKPVDITIVQDGKRLTTNIEVEPGMTRFGNPDEQEPVVVVSGLTAPAGAGVDVYAQSGDANEEKHFLPVLDGTLPEYRSFVLTAADLAPADEDAEQTEKSS